MSSEITVAQLRQCIDDPNMALIDVRETAEYNLSHIGGFFSLPRRLIESRLPDMVPWRGTRIVLADYHGRRAALASRTLEAMGYTDVSLLAGGINRWVSDGGETEWGVNVPSKDFGERVLLHNRVPEVSADELHAWQAAGRKIVLVDSRTPEEHARACIPGSRSMPGAELGLRMWDLAADPEATVVVHCAGRTRSIVGAATLQRMGMANVFALRNGTMGWSLADLELETGSGRTELPEPSAAAREQATAIARRLATEDGVRYIGLEELAALRQRAYSESVYLIDVRSRGEYAQGHIPGFQWVPGGQAVQASDSFVGVRGGSIVFTCDGVVRASMTASWFRQMGFDNVCVLEGGTTTWSAAGRALEPGMSTRPPFGYEEARAGATFIAPQRLNDLLASDIAARVAFVGTSEEFAAGHVPGAVWLPRGWLEPWAAELLPERNKPVVLSCPDGVQSVLALAALRGLGYGEVSVLDGGVGAWRAAGLPLEKGLTGVMRPPDDVLPAARSFAEMHNYLRWEEALGAKYQRDAGPTPREA